MFEIIILFIISVSFRSIHWQGAENELGQGQCKMADFGCKIIFHGFGVFGPAGGRFGVCFLLCRCAAAQFHWALVFVCGS